MDNQVLDRLDTQGFNHVRAVPNDDPVSQMRAREREIAELMDEYMDDGDQILDCVHNEVIDPDVFCCLVRAGIQALDMEDEAHVNTIGKSFFTEYRNAMRIKAEAA